MKLECSWRKSIVNIDTKVKYQKQYSFYALKQFLLLHTCPGAHGILEKTLQKKKSTLSLSMTDNVILPFELAMMSSELMESNKTCRAGKDAWSKTFQEKNQTNLKTFFLKKSTGKNTKTNGLAVKRNATIFLIYIKPLKRVRNSAPTRAPIC